MRAWLRMSVVLALALTGCKREVKHAVERVEVSGATVADNAVLALSPEQVRALLVEKLSQQGSFVLLKSGQHPSDDAPPVRMTLELAFTREAQKDGRPGTYADVGATLSLRRKGGESGTHYEVVGLGEVKVLGEGLDERQDAVRQALSEALEHAVRAAHLQLAALDKPDEVLVKELRAEDADVREYAIRVLAERRNPAVAPVLIERLKSNDADEVRRAIGGLVELREAQAVPALIELARGKEPSFLREILFALGAIGGEEAEAYLFTVAEGHDHEAIREAAQQALDELHAHAQGLNAGHEPRAAQQDGKEEHSQ